MTLLAVIALEVPLAISLSDRVDNEVRSQAQGQAEVLAASAADFFVPPATGALRQIVATAARTVHGRVIVVDGNGRVLGDSGGAAELGVSYASRPEIAAALRTRGTQGRRYSQTLGQELLVTAVPVLRGGATVGAVRITQSIAAENQAVQRIILELVLLGVVVLGVGLVVGIVIARQIARPIARLDDAARRVGVGDLTVRTIEEGSSEQRSLARSFNEMTARVGKLLEAQREFVADASHQLRTPLTGIRLRVEEARVAGVSPDADRELDAATAEVDRMAAIVDELLLLSRDGERGLPAELTDLSDRVVRAGARWAQTAAQAGIILTAQTPTEAAMAWAAAPDVDRALDALIENAMRYAGSDTEISLAARPGCLQVRDRGPGLAPGEEEAIWSRFHRGHAGRQVPGGTGLGLPIARELAREWGGEATLAPRAGGGLIASLLFPRARGGRAPDTTPADPSPLDAASGPANP